jgi:aminopeptidase N
VIAARIFLRIAACLLLSAGLGLSGCSKTPSKPAASARGISLAGETIPLGRLPRVAMPVRYRVALKIDPRADRFTGHVEIDVNFLRPERALFLHGLGLNISGVTVKLKTGQSFAAHYDQVDSSGVARLIFVDQVPAGEATLIFDYDAPFGRSLDGLYKVVDRGDSYAFTQFESTSARRVFPSFDEPGFKTPFDITVIAPRGLKTIGNTQIVAASPAAHGMVDTVFATTRPLPTYLVALAVGPLDVVDGGVVPANAYRAKPLHIRGITARGNGRRIGYALSLTPKIVEALERYFGIGYPFAKLDILAVPDFAAGAMENAGAVTFRERYLLIDADAPLEQKRASLAVQAHELAHQWFGDLVTPAWWDDTWLNESFADWTEYKAAAAVLPEMEFETDTLRGGLDVMDLDELPSARQIHQPIKNLDDLANAFDSITYDKGAAVLRMFESYAGPDAWQRGIHAYLTKFAYGNATAQDFIGTVAATTGHPEMVAAFNDFINHAGVPYLHVAGGCGPSTLNLTQTAYAPIGLSAPQRLWRVPVCAGDGGARTCRLMDTAKLALPLDTCSSALLPNAEGGGYYRFAFDEAGWKQAIAGAAALPPADQITLMANVFAAMRANDAQAGDALDVVKALAPVARWDVLKSMQKRLSENLRQSLAPADLPAYREFISGLFAARWRKAGPAAKAGETPSDTLLRQYLATLLVTEAHDAGTIAELSDAVRANLDSGKPIALEVRAEAMRAALLADPSYADRLVALFQTTDDENIRREIVYAFAGSDSAAAIDKLLALAPTKFRIGELRFLTEYMAAEPTARNELWRYEKANFDVLAKRVTVRGMGRMAEILQQACDAGARADADAFLAPRAASMYGAARRLAHTDERIARCIAFRRAKGAEVSSALAALTR